MPSSDYLVWIDLEMTGLKPDTDVIIEMATIVTDSDLNTLAEGPVIAVSDFLKLVPDQISRWVPGDYSSLGTDGFGRSDTRGALRRYFHVDAESIATARLSRKATRARSGPAVAITSAPRCSAI